ncbi:c-type cytochrome [Pontibacter sp. JH31]|uniref:Type IV secretion system putative lipoprotein virB7 n=1 Tax=Pontibacter aquaedesilientis TaxID=2766980 RepID=A0ABR7XGW4_9BACT|nr:c-type cytochrome [Pontibacter aquaedesilientis]MBD1397548.1 c-type cytochrome [Pontibacter aquaedesilientis]
MKKIFFAASAIALLTSCGGEQKSDYERYYDPEYQPDTISTAARMPTTIEKDNAKVVDEEGTMAGLGKEDTVGKKGAVAKAEALKFEKGQKLIAGSDCLACHKIDQKVVGPSYEEVAQKYEANDKNVSYLAGKIIKGGAGVWGEIPMPPHPNVSETDAKEMARYILALRK